jgi:primosomal protein N'
MRFSRKSKKERDKVTLTSTFKSCKICNQSLCFVAGRGWVHYGGNLYALRCAACGWRGAPYPIPAKCPACGKEGLRIDHEAE